MDSTFIYQMKDTNSKLKSEVTQNSLENLSDHEDNVVSFSKLNPFANEFVPLNFKQISEDQMKDSKRVAALTPTPRKHQNDESVTSANAQRNVSSTPRGKNVKHLEQTLDEFTENHKQLKLIKIFVEKAKEIISIELYRTGNKVPISEDLDDTKSCETVQINLNTGKPLESNSLNIAVAEFFRELSEVIFEEIRESCKKNECIEEEIADQIERIKIYDNTFVSPLFENTYSDPNVHRTIKELCKKFGISQTEIKEDSETKDTLNSSGAVISEKLLNSCCESINSSDGFCKIYKNSSNEKFKSINVSSNNSDVEEFSCSRSLLDAPPTTPAISETSMATINFVNYMKGRVIKGKWTGGGGICKSCRPVQYVATYNQDTVKEKPKSSKTLPTRSIQGVAVKTKKQTKRKEATNNLRSRSKSMTRTFVTKTNNGKEQALENSRKKLRKDEKSRHNNSSDKSLCVPSNGSRAKSKDKRQTTTQQKANTQININSNSRSNETTKRINPFWKI